MSKATGKCLCGSVSFEIEMPEHIDVCHCSDCRRWSGSPNMSVDFTKVTFTGDAGLTWYRSSEWAERGFCKICGSSLFYRLVEDSEKYTVCIGALDTAPENLSIEKEYFIDQKPEFYNFEGERQKLTGAEVFALYGAQEET